MKVESYREKNEKKTSRGRIAIHATQEVASWPTESWPGTEVASVNTMNCNGKNKRRGAIYGKTAETKKAIVKLSEGSKDIEIFSGI